MTEKCVLLIEDDPADRAFASAELRGWGAQVVEARDGPEGVLAISEWRNGDPVRRWPSFVLLDAGLPGMGGFDVLKEIRAMDGVQRVPVVMFSSSAIPEVIRAAYQLGANGYVIKPADAEAFRKAVGAMAAYWLRWNHPPG
jgi:CheY-like chemotaxis protein